MKTPQTDTPETDAECGSPDDATWPGAYVSADFARTLERRALAAEAMVKELETSKDAILKRAERIRIELVSVTKERDEARAALRLRPIAEAGPVPEGMVRVYADFINGEWEVTTDKWNGDTHYIDIYPPQQ
jgi:hypothetical protein